MKGRWLAKGFVLCLMAMALAACGGEKPIDVKTVMSQPKAFVGSDTCKQCHLEHYDSWMMTLHSRSTRDAQEDKDAIIIPLNEIEIRKDLKKLGKELKVPADQIYVPKHEQVKYVIGSQWQQRFVVEKEGTLYIAPIQYNVDKHRWVNYREQDWDQRPWLLKCGGCHATGVDLEKKTVSEMNVGCEACHGKGSWHAALPKTALFEKRQTIINPAKLTMGVAVQICGSCHKAGVSTKLEGVEWPVGYEPGKGLPAYYKSTSYAEGDAENFYPNEFSKGHHMQYNDWEKSSHYGVGVSCMSCHYVHQIGLPPTRSQTVSAGSQQCFECHTMINKVSSHGFHSFPTCVGCHMPKIAKNAESGDLRSHVFTTLLPKDTLKNPEIPNSCQVCHKHKDQDLKKLQMEAYPKFGEEMQQAEEQGEQKEETSEQQKKESEEQEEKSEQGQSS